MVTDLLVAGERFAGAFSSQPVTAYYDGASWAAAVDVKGNIDTLGYHPYGLHVEGTSARIVMTKSSEGRMFLLSQLTGTSWQKCEPGQACAGPTVPANAMWSGTMVGGDFWIGASDTIYRCTNGGGCPKQTTGLEGQTWGTGTIVGSGPQDIWYSAFNRAFHFDGTQWAIHPNLKARTIFQVRKDDVWVGDKTLQHWDGKAWSDELTIDGAPAPGIITSISGAASDDIWAVGYEGSVSPHTAFAARWDGKVWKKVPVPADATDLYSVYAPSRKEAFMTGQTGIWRWNGTAWVSMTTPKVPDAGLGIEGSWKVITGAAKPRP